MQSPPTFGGENTSYAMSEPSPYKVSTITATGCIGVEMNLDNLYNAIDIDRVEPGAASNKFITYVEYGTKKSDTVYKGTCKRVEASRRRKPKAKRFDNQVTIVIVNFLASGSSHIVNVKCFRNGNVQMTGLRHIESGHDIICFLMKAIERTQRQKLIEIVSDTSTMRGCDYRVRLINSDFKIGFDVKRDVLHRIVQFEYGVFATYEPCIYPGVKIQYFWNQDYGDNLEGRCRCHRMCSGKGTSEKSGFCKKITISVFQSGCVIITGAQSYKQVDDARSFLCALVLKHADRVRRVAVAFQGHAHAAYGGGVAKG